MTSRAQPVAQSLLARAHSPDTAARIFNDSINRRPLLLRATSPPPRSDNARAARRVARELAKKRRKVKPAPLSTRQRRRLGLYDIPAPLPRDQDHQGSNSNDDDNNDDPSSTAATTQDASRASRRSCRKGSFATFQALHRLWLGYVREILGSEVYTGGGVAAAKLAAAEFHGAEVEVVRSGCVSRVGIKGIVIKDAKFSFEIITPRDKVKIVPKEGTVFRVRVPAPEQDVTAAAAAAAASANAKEDAKKEFVFEIHGDQFRLRSADRANRKFKQHFSKNL